MSEDILEALTIIEEEENRTEKDIEIIREAKQEIKHLTSIIALRYERPYAKRYLEELRKEKPNLLYPDSEKIYEDYYELRDRIEKAIEYIEEYKASGMGEKWFKSSTPISYLTNTLKGIPTPEEILKGSDKG